MRKILVYITKVYVLIFMTGVFRESTVQGLEFYSDSHPSFKGTARYIKFILNIWKIMSLNSPSKGMRCILMLCNALLIYGYINDSKKHCCHRLINIVHFTRHKKARGD